MNESITIRTQNISHRLLALLCAAALCTVMHSGSLTAQAVHSQPVVDSAADASPMSSPASTSAVDTASSASPVSPTPHGEYIPPGVSIRVRLSIALDSATAHNGQSIRGTLLAPIRTSAGRSLPSGTDVAVTIVSAVPAGKLTSAGNLTLQVIRVGNVAVMSDIIERLGQVGDRSMPDSAPAKGTEASIAATTELTFSVSDIPLAPPPANTTIK